MALPKKYDFNDYDNYLTDPNPTTSAEAQDYFRNMDMLVTAMVDTFLWQPGTNYANGDVVKSPSMPNGAEAVCVAENGGKSSNVEPQWGSVGGENIADGTCFWKLRMQGTVTSVNGAKPNVNGEVTVPTMQGATATTDGASGLVPVPAKGDNEKFLCGDGSFKEAGKVKSVNGQIGDVVVEQIEDYVQSAHLEGLTIVLTKADGTTIPLTLEIPSGGNTVSVTGGTLSTNGTIPLPSGYTREQCKYAVWCHNISSTVAMKGLAVQVNQSTGKVSVSRHDGDEWVNYGTVGYICVAVK